MYNPNQDIVAGRTASQIESAKRRAVKGGGRKRCKKGKSCGATCINGSKVCLVDLPWVSSNGLTKVVKEIQGVSRENPVEKAATRVDKRSMSQLLGEMEGHYKEIRKINDASMPDGEKAWRREELWAKIDAVRSKIEAEAGKAGDKTGALKELKDKEDDFRIMSLGNEKLGKEARGALTNVIASKSVLMTNKNLDDTQVKTLREGIDSNLKRAEKYVGFMDPGRDKESLARTIGIYTGRIQPLSQGSLDEVSKAGKAFMDKYRNRLDSAFSIWNRRVALEAAITRKLKDDESLTFKQRMRLRRVLESIISRSVRANERSFKLMEEMRAELLKTKLSEDDIKGIMGRLKITGKNTPDNDPSIKQVRGQVEEFARMFNGKGLLEVTGDSGMPTGYLREMLVSPKERAYQQHGFVMTSGIPRVTFHEIAHIVELGRGWLANYAEKWRDGKAFNVRQVENAKGMERIIRDGDGKLIPYATQDLSGRNLPVFRLKEMPIHKNSIYDPNEIAVVDKFMDLYMGKVYTWKGSEVISMGMEKFASPQDMRHLYMNHPDLFETIVGLALT
jgi:hypothetical protein